MSLENSDVSASINQDQNQKKTAFLKKIFGKDDHRNDLQFESAYYINPERLILSKVKWKNINVPGIATVLLSDEAGTRGDVITNNPTLKYIIKNSNNNKIKKAAIIHQSAEFLSDNLCLTCYTPIEKINLLINHTDYDVFTHEELAIKLIREKIFTWQQCYDDAQAFINKTPKKAKIYRHIQATILLYAIDNAHQTSDLDQLIDFFKQPANTFAKEFLWEITKEKPVIYLGMNADAHERYTKALYLLSAIEISDFSAKKVAVQLENSPDIEKNVLVKAHIATKIQAFLNSQLSADNQTLTWSVVWDDKNKQYQATGTDQNNDRKYFCEIDAMSYKVTATEIESLTIKKHYFNNEKYKNFKQQMCVLSNLMRILSTQTNSTGLVEMAQVLADSQYDMTVALPKIIKIAKKRVASSDYARSSIIGKGRSPWVDHFYHAVSQLEGTEYEKLDNIIKQSNNLQKLENLGKKVKIEAFDREKIESNTMTEEEKQAFIVACKEIYGDANTIFLASMRQFFSTDLTVTELKEAIDKHIIFLDQVCSLLYGNIDYELNSAKIVIHLLIQEGVQKLVLDHDPFVLIGKINSMSENYKNRIDQEAQAQTTYLSMLKHVVQNAYSLDEAHKELEGYTIKLRNAIFGCFPHASCPKELKNLVLEFEQASRHLFEDRAIQSQDSEIQKKAMQDYDDKFTNLKNNIEEKQAQNQNNQKENENDKQLKDCLIQIENIKSRLKENNQTAKQLEVNQSIPH